MNEIEENLEKKGLEKKLDYWLDNVTVSEVDDYHNEVNDFGLNALHDWFMVCDETGVNAYFSTESAALRFRLDYINRKLNP